MVETTKGSKQEIKTEVKVPCEVYSRIVGYLRPVQAWNKGKRQEFLERKTFDPSVTEESEA
jgi:anaerobic ribonucleoside-triphosphate reductase